MCLWCGHAWSSSYNGDCDPARTGDSCGCTVTEEKQNAWMRWIETERPDRWVIEDWSYIMNVYG